MELLANPRLLILDEPTSGLSPDLDRSMMELCRRLSHQNCTVLMVTHNMSNINLCDKIALFGCRRRAVLLRCARKAERVL